MKSLSFFRAFLSVISALGIFMGGIFLLVANSDNLFGFSMAKDRPDTTQVVTVLVVQHETHYQYLRSFTGIVEAS